jgi:hypothetical protein
MITDDEEAILYAKLADIPKGVCVFGALVE